MNIKIYDIDWDTDGEDVELPIEIILKIPTDSEVVEYDTDKLADYLSDYLSDTFGWCHKGFKFDEI